jgi:predicted Zn-dependent protease
MSRSPSLPVLVSGAFVSGLVLFLCAPVRADLKAAQEALLSGRYSEAEAAFKAAPAAEKGPALLGLAETYATTGRYADALAQATQAAAIPATKARALCLTGEIDRETGKPAEAIRAFQAALAADPRLLRARVYLGVTQGEAGQDAAAEKTLDAFFQDFNAGKIDKNRADALTYTAMAATRLKAWQDANGTFQQAAEKDSHFLLANLEWGDLFQAKYRADEAAKCYQDVLKINPHLPRALVGMAEVQLAASYDVVKARKLADEALKVNPKYVPAFNLKARMALDDEQFPEAEALLKQSLAVSPADLDALALSAAARYLQNDTPGYEAARAKALKANPRFSQLYFIVGELAVRQHRYADGVALNRQAVALDPKNADALAALGTNLLRGGMEHEAEALKVLNQAFELDAFNVRTFNTLNLYDEVIAKEYATVPSGAFVFRFNKKEQPLLARYVPPLMQRAWDLYVRKYGFTPEHPVAVELFTERQHYGARTTGLPEIGAQGTCFGQLITAMSPSAAEASWELVLWHELAHVFHLQLSKNRVPRWFTEGLAEYETNVERPYWKRELTRDVFRSMQHGDLWKISELSAGFTHPDRPNGVILAYQQSSMVIHYLADTYGFPKIVEALKQYGQGKQDAEVLSAVTGKSMDALDAGFRDYLKAKYPYYATGFTFDQESYGTPEAAKAKATAAPSDAALQAAYAAALLGKDPEAAQVQARKTLALDAKQPLARYVLAETLRLAGDMKAAQPEYEALLAGGTDGYPVRLALGGMALAAGDAEAGAKHLSAAKRWDPDRTEPYALLIRYYEQKDRREDLLKETEGYLDLEEHDHDAARLLVDRYATDKRWADLARVAPRLLAITPMEPFVHQQYGRALAELGKPSEAVVELESALLAGVAKPAPTRALLAKQYLALGDKTKARAAAEQALADDPQNADAKAVLAGL